MEDNQRGIKDRVKMVSHKKTWFKTKGELRDIIYNLEEQLDIYQRIVQDYQEKEQGKQ